MYSLAEVHTFFDQSAFDHHNLDEIKKAYSDLIETTGSKVDKEVAYKIDLEWKALNIRKSFDYKEDSSEGRLNGLSWQMSGTKTLADGTVLPHYWPDVVALTDNDFKYFEEVWHLSKNDFIKAEFGLLVYFGKRTSLSKKQQFASELFNVIWNLAQSYEHKIIGHDDYKFYYTYFIQSIKLLAGIAFTSKLGTESSQLADYLSALHKNSIFFEKGLLALYAEVTSLLSKQFRGFKNLLSFDEIIQSNLVYISQLKEINLWAAIGLIHQSEDILKKQKKEATHLIQEKAGVYEKLADDALINNPAAASSFMVDAMKYYKSASDSEGYARMQERYAIQRGKVQLTDFGYEVPEVEIKDIHHKIKVTIQDGDTNELILLLIGTPWYSKYEVVKKHAIEIRALSPLLSILPVAVMDKFGNVIARFTNPDEIQRYDALNSYNINIQMGTYVMVNFILRAVESKKLDFEGVIDHLANTWFNDPIPIQSQNKELIIFPISTLRPVIKRFFIELNHFIAGNSGEMDLMTLTDSMTLRIEQLLRQFFLKAGIPTFKRKKGVEDIMMEKTLDELLAELESNPDLNPDKFVNFNEDHRQLIKFVLTEKAGWNLRNEIAHGLMDIQEYTIEKPIVLFSIILKLSSYQFDEKMEETTHDS